MLKLSREFPKRGYIYIADLDPGFGREIHKKRPVLVVSNNDSNRGTPYVVIIPSSSVIPELISPDMVHIGKLKGLNKDSVLLPLFIRSIDKDRLVKKVRKLSQEKLFEIEEALKLVLNLEQLD